MVETVHIEVLSNIDDSDLELLSEFYKNHGQLCYASSCLANGYRIRNMVKGFPIRFMSPVGDWKTNGTFFVVFEFDTVYELGLFGAFSKPDAVHQSISAGLNLSGRIHYDCPKRNIVFKYVHHNLYYTLMRFIETKHLEVQKEDQYHIYRLSNEDALKFEIKIPKDVKLKPLARYNASKIHDQWPCGHRPTEEYIRILIQVNGGYGLVSQPEGELLSWGLITMMGTIGFVQTLEPFRKKGYATLIVQILAKELAYEHQHPVAVVGLDNAISHMFLERIGFRPIGSSHDVHVKLKTHVSKCDPSKQIKELAVSNRVQHVNTPSTKDWLEAGPSSSSVDISSKNDSTQSTSKERVEDFSIPELILERGPTSKNLTTESTFEIETSKSVPTNPVKKSLLKMKKLSLNILATLSSVTASSTTPSSVAVTLSTPSAQSPSSATISSETPTPLTLCETVSSLTISPLPAPSASTTIPSSTSVSPKTPLPTPSPSAEQILSIHSPSTTSARLVKAETAV